MSLTFTLPAMLKYLILLIGAVSLFEGCYTRGEVAKVSMARNFNEAKTHRILIAPFAAEGNPDASVDNVLSDKISMALLDLGYTVIDQHALYLRAEGLGLDISKGIKTEDLPKLATALNADAILLGTTSYTYVPPTSGVEPVEISTDTNRRGSIAVIHASGGGSYNIGGYYEPTSMSMKLINIPSYETFATFYINKNDLNGYLNSSTNYTMSDELIEALKKKFSKV